MRLASLLLALLAVSAGVRAQTSGSCATGTASGTLDDSAVRASFPNTGTLFYGPRFAAAYVVPVETGASPIYSASIWVGGTVDGEIRVAGTTYGQVAQGRGYEFWPGPLDDGAVLPNSEDCSAFDRIWVVSLADLGAYVSGLPPSDDLRDWPVGLGAPAVTASGAPVAVVSRAQTLDLEAGERPVVFGTQAAFWVMNDVGNDHQSSGSEPLGIEVAVTAFAVASETPALNEATFYRYQITNRNTRPIEEMRVGLYADTDLGGASDDFLGVDTTRALAFTYNAREEDGGYGSPPPAVGVDLLGGQAGVDPAMESFVDMLKYLSGPNNASEYWNVLRGRFPDGTLITEFGNGYQQGGSPTLFSFPGDPVTRSFWSEEDTGSGRNNPEDKRFAFSSLLGTLAPGASATIDYAVVYARGVDRLDSVTELRAASDEIQTRYDQGTLFAAGDIPSGPPPALPALVSPASGEGPLDTPVLLTWTASPDAVDYLVEISQSPGFEDPVQLIVDGTNVTYQPPPTGTFEAPEVTAHWRVTARRGALVNRTEAQSFVYTSRYIPDVYVVEITGPGGADPCGPSAVSTLGCPSPGSPLVPTRPGNIVYDRDRGNGVADALNGTGAYLMTYFGPAEGTLGTPTPTGSNLARFAPSDFEVRVVPEDEGSYAYYLFSSKRMIRVPFQIWDVGVVTPGQPNDPADDIQMVPVLFADAASSGEEPVECTFGFFGPEIFDGADGTGRTTQRIYAYYPVGNDYAAFAAQAQLAVDADPDACPAAPATDAARARINTSSRPIQRDVFVQAGTTTTMADLEGAVIRYYTREGSGGGTPTEPSIPETAGLALDAPQPNPVSGTARIAFRTTAPGPARLTLVDVLGRRVAVLADGVRQPGEHSAEVDASGLAAGVYVVVMESGGARVSRLVTVSR